MIIGKINSIQTIDKRVSDARGKKLEVQGTMMDAPEFFFSFFFFYPEFIGFRVFHRNRFLLSIIPQPSSNSRNVVPSLGTR